MTRTVSRNKNKKKKTMTERRLKHTREGRKETFWSRKNHIMPSLRYFKHTDHTLISYCELIFLMTDINARVYHKTMLRMWNFNLIMARNPQKSLFWLQNPIGCTEFQSVNGTIFVLSWSTKSILTGCSLNIVFLPKILEYSVLCFPLVPVCVHTPGRQNTSAAAEPAEFRKHNI